MQRVSASLFGGFLRHVAVSLVGEPHLSLIKRYSGTDENSKRVLVNFVVLVKVDRPPFLTLELVVEELVRVWKTGTIIKVNFTLFLNAFAKQTIPLSDQTGVPIHFHSSTISGSAARIIPRMLAKVVPRQSVRFEIRSSISSLAFFIVFPHIKLLENVYQNIGVSALSCVGIPFRVLQNSGL